MKLIAIFQGAPEVRVSTIPGILTMVPLILFFILLLYL